MQRITDLWKSLVTIIPNNESEQENERIFSNEEIESNFKNMYWIRLITMQDN